MKISQQATLLLAAAALGCAHGASTTRPGEAGPNGEVMLAYAAQATPLTYVSTDSSRLRLDIPGMGPLDVTYSLGTTRQLSLATAGSALDASVKVTELSGRMDNPQTGATAIDNSVIPTEPARLTVLRAGDITGAEFPELSRSLREVTTSTMLYRSLFVRLPEGAVRPGASWVDTVAISDRLATMELRQSQEQHSTYVGDTVVGGRRLARISTAVTATINVTGDAGGMQIEQHMTGSGTQSVLWDAARGVLVERIDEGTASGTMTVVGAGIGDIPLTQQVRTVVRLKEGG